MEKNVKNKKYCFSLQNNSEINQTDPGFLSSILNDEDLQLMDMAMNEGKIPIV